MTVLSLLVVCTHFNLHWLEMTVLTIYCILKVHWYINYQPKSEHSVQIPCGILYSLTIVYSISLVRNLLHPRVVLQRFSLCCLKTLCWDITNTRSSISVRFNHHNSQSNTLYLLNGELFHWATRCIRKICEKIFIYNHNFNFHLHMISKLAGLHLALLIGSWKVQLTTLNEINCTIGPIFASSFFASIF